MLYICRYHLICEPHVDGPRFSSMLQSMNEHITAFLSSVKESNVSNPRITGRVPCDLHIVLGVTLALLPE